MQEIFKMMKTNVFRVCVHALSVTLFTEGRDLSSVVQWKGMEV